MKGKLGLGVLALLATGLLAACGAGDNSSNEADKKDQLQVVTTFYPVYDFTKNIVGDEGEVSLLVPAGTEAHDYEPSAKDAVKIADADVFVYHNENMEGWVTEASKAWQDGSPNIIKGTEGMVLLPGSDAHSHDEDEEGHDHEEDHDHESDHDHEGHSHAYDPHTWVAPSMAIKEVQAIRDQLIDLYPEKKAALEKNADAYLEKLAALDESYQTTLAAAKQKSFVTQHAAFNYLAVEYGLTQVPIAGLTPDQEPSAKRLAELKHYVEDNGINYIYFENNASDKIAKTLADEANVELAVLNPLESLTKEQLDAGEDYLSVMAENLKALQKTTDTAGPEVQPETAKANDTKTVHHGYFADEAVMDRSLSDYAGEWQSVYPLLQDGTLDQVFDYKAKLKKDKSAEAYKKYYEVGYKTDVDEIKITDDTMTFIVAGEARQFTYKYAGYKILDYAKGNRGVRFCFEATDPEAGKYRYVQFSDHGIAPAKALHFHIFFGGDSQEALYEEMTNWPTYYPAALSKQEIAQEMMAH